MELAAVGHYGDKRDCYALEKKKFLIRLRTKKGDMKQVTLLSQDKYLDREVKDTRTSRPMELVASDGILDYYEAVVEMDVGCIRYFFQLEDQAGEQIYYGNYIFYKECIENRDYMFDCPQNLREEEIFLLPDWAKNKVVYQIFPSRFASDQEIEKDVWYQAPIHANADLKGNLAGVLEHLTYLKELGVDVIYFTPIFQSSSQHKYNTTDYYKIDPAFGTEEQLRKLVERAHQLGMYVVLDGVFHHTGTEFFAFADLLEKQEASSYKDWYYVKEYPVDIQKRESIPYKTFSYSNRMPKLNLSKEEVSQYFIDVACYWIRQCNIDGWRLDVGDEVVHDFWKQFRKAVKKEKEELLIIGEIWHYAPDFLEGDEWDTVMNYPFFFAVQQYVAEESISIQEFWNQLSFMRGHLHKKCVSYMWNLIDSHDTARFLYSCQENKEKLKLAAAIQLLLPGMPVIYYGDEYAMTGAMDPDCRRGMVWDTEYQDTDMCRWYRKLIALRNEIPELLQDSWMEFEIVEDKDVLLLDRGNYEIVIHGRKGAVELPDYLGWKDRLSEQEFSGELGDYQVALLVKM